MIASNNVMMNYVFHKTIGKSNIGCYCRKLQSRKALLFVFITIQIELLRVLDCTGFKLTSNIKMCRFITYYTDVRWKEKEIMEHFEGNGNHSKPRFIHNSLIFYSLSAAYQYFLKMHNCVLNCLRIALIQAVTGGALEVGIIELSKKSAINFF